jgi:hypothetical protein
MANRWAVTFKPLRRNKPSLSADDSGDMKASLTGTLEQV